MHIILNGHAHRFLSLYYIFARLGLDRKSTNGRGIKPFPSSFAASQSQHHKGFVVISLFTNYPEWNYPPRYILNLKNSLCSLRITLTYMVILV